MLRRLRSLPDLLTSRRGAWVSLLVGILVLVGLIGALGRAEAPARNDSAPAASESAVVADEAAGFPDAGQQSLLVVASRDDEAELTASDLDDIAGLLPVIGDETGADAAGPIPSEDGEAAVIQATITPGDADGAEAKAVRGLRDALAAHPIDGVQVQVTGGPAFGVDIAASFAGADFTLLIVTIAIVALLLIVTYRSPVLWIVPLVVVALADQLANKATAAIGSALELQFDSGIVSVLVFGAGTNYALLLVSRYRDELLREPDHRRALGTAWRSTAPAVFASNVTVVLSLTTLVFAVIPGTRGLGISSAVGLLIALVVVLFVLPPALAVCGRGLFWPFVPRPGAAASTRPGFWRTIANGVVRRPVAPLLGGLLVLGVLATGLAGATVGLTQVEKFRVPSESAAGLEVLGAHFPAGEAQPMVVIADTAKTDAVIDAAEQVDGVVRVSTADASADGDRIRLIVTAEPEPGSAAALQLVRDLRAAVHGVDGAQALVGGASGADVDARDGNLRDVLLIVPLVLLVSLTVLILLLRALVAPVLLLLVNALSALAAIGAGAWLSRVLFGWEALDLQVPLLSFLFLVALGIDYTIFLVHRAKAESAAVGTRRGMVNALASTGGVITSAGVVLAAVFAALGLLPLVTLGQIGLIVGVGVLVDTLVVRTLIVPALFAVLGDRMWWPRRRVTTGRDSGQEGEEYGDAEAHDSVVALR